ncbi:MAG: phosphoadenylyl-sulfate reductase [Hyphomicrobiaceae bacterium]
MTELRPFDPSAAAIPARPSHASAHHLDGLLASLASLEARIKAIASTIDGRIAFSTSLGLEDQVVLHAIAASGAPIDIFMLDTGRHFPETIETVAASEARYGVHIRVVAPEADELAALVARDGVLGFRTSIEARKTCCDVRKVRPLDRQLVGAAAWITGLRRGQSGGRTLTPLSSFDGARDLIKLNPIADWDLPAVEAYVARHHIPVNALHARGFPSIGCAPCTRAILPGEDIRAGRWWWESASGKECGLHSGAAIGDRHR